MCRWLAYTGRKIGLDAVITRPTRSLVHQSRHATECRTSTHGDGFGLGWYGGRTVPGVYRDVTPAWSDENLQSLCTQLRAKTFFAHVRAATTGTTTRANCHPFTVGPWLFMHNGQIGGFNQIRRVVENMIPDRHYCERRGTTDSEAIFLAALARVENEGPIVAFAETLGRIRDEMSQASITAPLRFAAVISDGELLTVFRWASDEQAPSVFSRSNEQGLTVASEPLDDRVDDWQVMPPNHVLTAGCAKASARPALMRFVVGREDGAQLGRRNADVKAPPARESMLAMV